MISFTCEGYHILPLLTDTSGFSSEDTIFIQFFYAIGSIGLECDNGFITSQPSDYYSLISSIFGQYLDRGVKWMLTCHWIEVNAGIFRHA